MKQYEEALLQSSGIKIGNIQRYGGESLYRFLNDYRKVGFRTGIRQYIDNYK